MKKNENKKKIKESQNKLSPCLQRKKNIFYKGLLKDFVSNNVLLSPKKTQEELLLPKKKIIPSTSHHRRTKSNNQNYIQYMTSNNINFNSVSKLSFILRQKKLENNNNFNNNYSSVSRNKRKNNYEENKKSSNLLSISFSLKDFRNNIVNAFSHSNIFDNKNNNLMNNKNKIINLKNNKSVFNFDNYMNIEETRNTTSITNFNNSILLYNKNKEKEKQNSKSTKYIKINTKPSKKIYSSSKNSSQIITYTNNDIIKEKIKPKSNFYRYIYKNNNNIIKTKKSNKNTSNITNINTNTNTCTNNNTNNLILTKKTFRNSQKYFSKLTNNKKFNFMNPLSVCDKTTNFNYLEFDNDDNKNFNGNICPSTTRNSKKKKIKRDLCHKYNKRKTKSQDNNNCKIGINNTISEFKSVEEIHFIFVQINQKKKAFFEKGTFEKENTEKVNL